MHVDQRALRTGRVERARDLADHLQQHPELALADVAATLMRGRKPMAQRLSVVITDIQQVLAQHVDGAGVQTGLEEQALLTDGRVSV